MNDIDSLDRKILALLMQNANMPYTDIAKQLYISGGTVHVRMKKLEHLGIVKGSHIEINYHRLGYDITAFLGIYLEKSSQYDMVSTELSKIPEIVDAHYITGMYSIFAKLICRDTKHLKDVLHDKIQMIQGVQRTETFISLQESISRALDITEES